MRDAIGYYDGAFGPLDQVTAPVLDRAFYFGDGVYDATIVNHGAIVYEEDHVERFYNSARLVHMDPVVDQGRLREVLRRLADDCPADNAFLYWQMSRGTAPRSHAFPKDIKPNLMAYIVPSPEVDLSQATTAHLVEDTRFYHCNAKTLNLLPNVLAQQEAVEAGFDEAIFVRDGYVTECAHSNVHILSLIHI